MPWKSSKLVYFLERGAVRLEYLGEGLNVSTVGEEAVNLVGEMTLFFSGGRLAMAPPTTSLTGL